MSADRWQRLESLFEQGIALAPTQREQWLRGLDLAEDLRAELRRMLAADAGAEDAVNASLHGAVAASLAAAQPGQRLGPYRLLRALGRGGMGEVFLAERVDGDFHQQVAIKLIHRLAALDAARQLRHERQVLAGLLHPGIARLYDGGETAAGQPYLVMEYVEGQPITEACEARGLGLRQRLQLIGELAGAVHYAHQRLVIHRDIKPANVLLREDGRAVLLDFGIAKLLDAEAAGDATQPWFTPAYASPEQRRGEPASTATDVYALGLLLWQLLVGKPPRADADGALPAPSRAVDARRARALRGDLDTLVLRATAPEPGRRYASAEALAEDIQRWLDGRPLRAAPDRLGYRLNKLLRRHPVASAAILLLAALLAVAVWRLADERDRALRAEQVASREAASARSVTRFLVELFAEAEPGKARSAVISPSALLDRGRELLAANAEIGAEQRVALLGTLAGMYVNLGEPHKADDTLQTALAAVPAGADADRAELLQWLGQAHELRQRFADAEAAYLEAVALLRQVGDLRPLSDSLGSLGLIQSRLDRNAEAEAALREAIRLRRVADGAGSVDAMRFEAYLSEVLANTGREALARQTMERALAGLRAALPADDPELMSVLAFYGVLLRDAGESAAAERVFQEILAHRQRLLHANSHKIALVHNNLGRVYYNTGRTTEAIEQFRLAYELGDRPGGQNDPSRAIDMINLGSLYEMVGDYPQALPLMRGAATILEADPDNARALLPMVRQNLGRTLLLAGEAEESRRWLEIPIDAREDRDWSAERGRQRLHLAEWERRYGSAERAHHWLREAAAHVDDMGGPDSTRFSLLERTRARLALAEGDFDAARADLERARERLVRQRSETFVPVGELSLDLAELALAAGDREAARREWQRAMQVLDPVLVASAPQRQTLAAVAAALDGN